MALLFTHRLHRTLLVCRLHPESNSQSLKPPTIRGGWVYLDRFLICFLGFAFQVDISAAGLGKLQGHVEPKGDHTMTLGRGHRVGQ